MRIKSNLRSTDSPSAPVGVHVTVGMQRRGGTSWVDGVHATGAGVVMAIDVITVDGHQENLGVGVNRGRENQHGEEQCRLDVKEKRES